MRKSLVLAVASIAVVAASLSAQGTSRSPVFRVTPYVGYMVFGDQLDGPLGTSLRNANSPLYGAQLGIDLGKHVSVIGNVGYATSDWSVKVPIVGGITIGDADVLLYDAGLQFALPLGISTVKPILQVGAGAMRYSSQIGPVKTESTNFAVNAGVGLDYQVSRSFGVRLLARDYVGKFDFKEATGLGLEGKTAHNVALSVGVGFGF